MNKKLFVGGLPWAVDDETLRSHFEPFGEVIDARVIYDRDTGRSRGFGFVTFEEAAAADEAINALNESELDGRTIRVNEAQERQRPSGNPYSHGRGGPRGGRGGPRGDRGDRGGRW